MARISREPTADDRKSPSRGPEPEISKDEQYRGRARSAAVTARGLFEESGSQGREVDDSSAPKAPGTRAAKHRRGYLSFAVLMELRIYVSEYAALLRFDLFISISIHRVRDRGQKIHTDHLYRTIAQIMFISYSTIAALSWLAIRGTSAVRKHLTLSLINR